MTHSPCSSHRSRKSGVGRVVAGAHGVDVVLFHEQHVRVHGRVVQGPATVGVPLVPVHAAQQEGAAVGPQQPARDLDRAQADAYRDALPLGGQQPVVEAGDLGRPGLHQADLVARAAGRRETGTGHWCRRAGRARAAASAPEQRSCPTRSRRNRAARSRRSGGRYGEATGTATCRSGRSPGRRRRTGRAAPGCRPRGRHSRSSGTPGVYRSMIRLGSLRLPEPQADAVGSASSAPAPANPRSRARRGTPTGPTLLGCRIVDPLAGERSTACEADHQKRPHHRGVSTRSQHLPPKPNGVSRSCGVATTRVSGKLRGAAVSVTGVERPTLNTIQHTCAGVRRTPATNAAPAFRRRFSRWTRSQTLRAPGRDAGTPNRP